jgi:hypothetical protein
MGTQPNGPIRELRWWQIPSWIPRWRVGLAGALVAGLVVGVVVGLVAVLAELLYRFAFFARAAVLLDGLVGGLKVGLIFGLFGGLVVGLLSGLGGQAVVPRSITIRWPKLEDLGSASSMALGVGLVGGLGFALYGVALFVGSEGLGGALLYGVLVGLFGGVVTILVIGFPIVIASVWGIPLACYSRR